MLFTLGWFTNVLNRLSWRVVLSGVFLGDGREWTWGEEEGEGDDTRGEGPGEEEGVEEDEEEREWEREGTVRLEIIDADEERER